MIKEFLEFVNEIQKDSSRLYKESVLKKYSNNNDIKYLLNFVYNTYIVTGISSKKLQKTNLSNTHLSELELFEYFKKNNTGRDEDVGVLNTFKTNFSVEEQKLIDQIISKNLQLGIDVKTINKVIPNLCSIFNVQLANKYFDNPNFVENKEFWLTTKIDGSRIIAIKEDQNVYFFTRAGQRYLGLVDLEEELKNVPQDNFVLDGELTLLDKGNLSSKEQFKETMKISRKDGIKHGLKMLVFDYLELDEFKNNKSYTMYSDRREKLNKLFTNTFTYFSLLPILYHGTDTTKITELLNKAIKAGEEGLMINLQDVYQFKRTSSLLKVKKMNDLDLTVTGFEEGTNRLAGTLGALLVEYKNNIVKVGSGFSDELRKEIWMHQEEWLGRTVIIQYFEETRNQDGGISLRFPVYIDYRDDK